MGRACSTQGEKRKAYRILVGKPEGKRPLGRPRHRLEENINMDFRGIGWGGMDYIDLVQDRDQWRALMNSLMNFQVPQIQYAPKYTVLKLAYLEQACAFVDRA
jgi:hypothetical protein